MCRFYLYYLYFYLFITKCITRVKELKRNIIVIKLRTLLIYFSKYLSKSYKTEQSRCSNYF